MIEVVILCALAGLGVLATACSIIANHGERRERAEFYKRVAQENYRLRKELDKKFRKTND